MNVEECYQQDTSGFQTRKLEVYFILNIDTHGGLNMFLMPNSFGYEYYTCIVYPVLWRQGVCYPEGGEYSLLKRLLTVARLPQNCGSQAKLLKRSSCPVIMNVHRELSNLLI